MLQYVKEAKQIIENYKVEYQQYLGDVPSFIFESDEAGFYSRFDVLLQKALQYKQSCATM